MPIWFIFVIGILQDTFYGLPLGITPLTNITLILVVYTQRRLFMKESFAMVWLGFVLLSLAIALIRWIIFMAMETTFFIPYDAGIQFFLTAAFYPLLHGVNNLIYTHLPDRQANA